MESVSELGDILSDNCVECRKGNNENQVEYSVHTVAEDLPSKQHMKDSRVESLLWSAW